jgi:hypothetical protein
MGKNQVGQRVATQAAWFAKRGAGWYGVRVDCGFRFLITESHHEEKFMTKSEKGPNQSNKNSRPPQEDVTKQKQKQKAEGQEVAGRHKNDGQKDHKGRR